MPCFSLGPMAPPARHAFSLEESWETSRKATNTRESLAYVIAVLHLAANTLILPIMR